MNVLEKWGVFGKLRFSFFMSIGIFIVFEGFVLGEVVSLKKDRVVD